MTESFSDGKTTITTKKTTTTTTNQEQVEDGRPKVLAPLSDAVVPLGGAVRLTLKVNDPKVKVEWSKDGRKIQDGGRHKLECVGRTMTLEVAQVEKSDAGLYEVALSNDLGTASTSCLLSIDGEFLVSYCGAKFTGWT